jgi:DNA helicase IV
VPRTIAQRHLQKIIDWRAPVSSQKASASPGKKDKQLKDVVVTWWFPSW